MKKMNPRMNKEDIKTEWQDLKDDEWDLDVFFSTGNGIFLKTNTAGSSIWAKRSFDLEEIDSFPEPNDNDGTITTIQLISALKVIHFVGSKDIDIKSRAENDIIINPKDLPIIFNIQPIENDEEPTDEESSKEETENGSDEDDNSDEEDIKDTEYNGEE